MHVGRLAKFSREVRQLLLDAQALRRSSKERGIHLPFHCRHRCPACVFFCCHLFCQYPDSLPPSVQLLPHVGVTAASPKGRAADRCTADAPASPSPNVHCRRTSTPVIKGAYGGTAAVPPKLAEAAPLPLRLWCDCALRALCKFPPPPCAQVAALLQPRQPPSARQLLGLGLDYADHFFEGPDYRCARRFAAVMVVCVKVWEAPCLRWHGGVQSARLQRRMERVCCGCAWVVCPQQHAGSAGPCGCLRSGWQCMDLE